MLYFAAETVEGRASDNFNCNSPSRESEPKHFSCVLLGWSSVLSLLIPTTTTQVILRFGFLSDPSSKGQNYTDSESLDSLKIPEFTFLPESLFSHPVGGRGRRNSVRSMSSFRSWTSAGPLYLGILKSMNFAVKSWNDNYPI